MSIRNEMITQAHHDMADNLEEEGQCTQPTQRVSVQKLTIQEQHDSSGNSMVEEERSSEAATITKPTNSRTSEEMDVVTESENCGFERLPEGSIVVICGLKSETGKTLNGVRGCVLAFIPNAQRYLLKIDGEKMKKRVKALNVRTVGISSTIDYGDILETAKLLKRPLKRVLNKGVDIRKFNFGCQIGKGQNSRIIVATKQPGYDMGEDPSITKVALKAISKELLRTSDQSSNLRQSLLNERKTMYKCRGINPFILDLYATARGEHDIFFVMEYLPNSDLQHWAWKLHGLPRGCVRFYIACLVDALEAMHEIKVYHRDVKPENLFLDEHYLPKLGDFGCSIEHGDAIDFIGTPHYMPPEMIRHQVEQDTVRATDYWSLGATVYYLEFGRLCFWGASDYLIMTKSRDCVYEMPEHGDETTKDLIRSLLVVDIKKRLGWHGGWQEIKSHKFFEEVDWDALRLAKEPPVHFWESQEAGAETDEMRWHSVD